MGDFFRLDLSKSCGGKPPGVAVEITMITLILYDFNNKSKTLPNRYQSQLNEVTVPQHGAGLPRP